MKKIGRPHIIIPLFIALSIAALVMRKLGVPFASVCSIVIFDGMAVFFLFQGISYREYDDEPGERHFHMDTRSAVYAICTIAILWRLQNWPGSKAWTVVAFIVVLLLSVSFIRILRSVLANTDKAEVREILLEDYLPCFFFLIVVSFSFFTNPRQFYNFFNANTYEQYIRGNYSAEEGTGLLEQTKPGDESSEQKSIAYFDNAKDLESKEAYDEALEFYNKAIDLNPDYAEAIEQRGFLKLVHLDLSREGARDAIADFTRAIELKPDLAIAYYHRIMANEFLNPHQPALMSKDAVKLVSLDSSYRSNKLVKNYLRAENK